MGADSGCPAEAPRVRRRARSPCLATGRPPEKELEDLYCRLYLPLVTRVRWRFRLSSEDARDIVQDAFAIALVKLGGSNHPKEWLIQVVDFLAANLRRKLKRRAELLTRWTAETSSLVRAGRKTCPSR